VIGSYVLLPSLSAGVRVVDVSDPTQPRTAATFAARNVRHLAALGDHVAVLSDFGLILAELQSSATVARGDVNLDFVITAADLIYLVNYTFKGGPEPLPVAANGDVNCDGVVSAADAIFLVNYLFKSGLAPDCP
jgi:hypothetical protein